MKERLRQPKAQKVRRAPLVACGCEERGGVVRGGAQCVGGMWVYWATAHDREGHDLYGHQIRWAKPCACRVAWSQNTEAKMQAAGRD
jgi:hypothetical protein